MWPNVFSWGVLPHLFAIVSLFIHDIVKQRHFAASLHPFHSNYFLKSGIVTHGVIQILFVGVLLGDNVSTTLQTKYYLVWFKHEAKHKQYVKVPPQSWLQWKWKKHIAALQHNQNNTNFHTIFCLSMSPRLIFAWHLIFLLCL